MADLEELSRVQHYLGLIAAYDREFKDWQGRAEKIEKRYRDDSRVNKQQTRFNVLWSNTQILCGATFARLPKPDVSRRFRDQDPVGRVASLILERALEFEIESTGDFREAMKATVQDRFLGGRGTTWVRYEPEFGPIEDGIEVTEDTDDAEQITWEHSPVDYVHWRDFGHTIARTWQEVTAVWRRVFMGRDALIDRFGEELGRRIPLDTTPEELKQSGKNLGDPKNSQAAVYEIWDKAAGTAIWLSKSMNQILDERDDPLGLDDFWPCPKPLYATLTTDSLKPTPDFALYQDQAASLDVLADRIDGLVNALKVRGVYDAGTPELARLFTEGENNALVPVSNWAGFVEKQGLKGAIDLIDLTPIASALREAYGAMEQIKGQIYEITGISDILRGASDPNETLGAQQIKSSSGSLRLKNNREDAALFATELLKIKAQIICGQYRPETILRMSSADQLNPADMQYILPALQLLKDHVLRGFRIEVSTDSMVQMDELQEQQARVSFLQATGGFLKQAADAVQQAPEIGNLVLEMLKFGVTGFKVGKSLEGVFDEAADQIKKTIAQQQANPKPNPEMMKLQAEQQANQAKVQADLAMHQNELQAKIQLDAAQKQHEIQLEQFKSQNEMRVEEFRQRMQAAQVTQQNQVEGARDIQKAHLDAQLGAMQQQIDVLIARLNNEARIEVAEISSGTQLQAAQIAAASQGSSENA